MKMKMFTMLAALSLSATAVFAQKGVEDGSRFGHGEDSLRCLQNEELRKQLASMNAHVMGVTSNPYYDAPTYVLVLVPADANNPIQDGSCVLENMMLAAHAIGLGSCWIHREREMFSTPEGKELMKSWGLPEGLVGIGALALGYPAEEPAQPKPRKQDYYRVIK